MGAFHQRIKVASELAWYSLQYLKLSVGTGVFRNFIFFFFSFSVYQRLRGSIFLKEDYKTKSLRYKKTEETANCSMEHVHS